MRKAHRDPQKGHPALELVITKSPRAWLLLSKWEGLSSLGYSENKCMAKKIHLWSSPLAHCQDYYGVIMVSILAKDSFHSHFPPTQSLVFLRPLMSHTHTHTCKTPAWKAATSSTTSQKKAATISSKPSFLLLPKLVHKLCKSEARAERSCSHWHWLGRDCIFPSGSSLWMG